MGRSCYVIKNKEGGIDNVLAPNDQPSGLYQRAMEVLGDQKQALSVWGTAYSPDFVSFFGDWMSMPSEYDLDSNGEPRYDDVMSFIKRKNYFAGNFMADEVKDINNTLTSLGVDNINDLNDMIVSNFLSGGDIFLNRYNLERSGMYDADEIDNIMTNRSEYERVRDMMRRIVDFMSEGNLNEKDMYFLSSESGLGDDYMIYEDTYDSLGKRRGLNPIEVRDTIMKAVGGISDRREFDQAFASIPYPSLALRYQEDQDYADRMYDTYRNMTRMEVRSQDGNTITDSYFNSTTPYISMPKDMKGLRDKVGEIIDMDDFKDIKDVAGRLHDIAMDLADMGVDISEAISDEMIISRPEDIRDLMASLDVMLSSIQAGNSVYDSFISDLDRITGKGNPIYEVQDTYSTGDRMVYVRSGNTSPSDMYDRSMLYMGRNTYHNTAPITDTDQAYEMLADIGIERPSYLPAGVVPAGASRSDIGVVKDNIKKLVMSNVQKHIWQRTAVNRYAGVTTRIFLDEFHLLLKEPQTAAYTAEIYKRFRKWNGIPTSLTQNVKDLLESSEIENILENSDFVLMLNQGASDRNILAQRLGISPQELNHVTNSGEGEGLLFFGDKIIPFEDKFPRDTQLYRVMTTKPSDLAA